MMCKVLTTPYPAIQCLGVYFYSFIISMGLVFVAPFYIETDVYVPEEQRMNKYPPRDAIVLLRFGYPLTYVEQNRATRYATFVEGKPESWPPPERSTLYLQEGGTIDIFLVPFFTTTGLLALFLYGFWFVWKRLLYSHITKAYLSIGKTNVSDEQH